MIIEQIGAYRSVPFLSILLAQLLLLTAVAVGQETVEAARLSEPIVKTDRYEVFGEAMPTSGQSYALSDGIEHFDRFKGNNVTFTGTINEVCQQKGCWMIISQGGRTARVTFKDYGFFVPTNSAGRSVRLSGILREVVLTEDEARHFADDARPGSGAAITGPQKEYSIEATSVQIFTD